VRTKELVGDAKPREWAAGAADAGYEKATVSTASHDRFARPGVAELTIALATEEASANPLVASCETPPP
jgi:hypothetical protein